jgi:hypothetical protein
MKESRRVAVPSLCSWCGQVQVGSTWMEDRRVTYQGRYANGVCPKCKGDYFMDALYQEGARKR